MGESLLHRVGTHPAQPAGDVVFVHGTGGDWRTTWMADEKREETFWPAWLAEALPQANVWSLEYDARRLARGDEPLPLSPTADKALNALYGKGLGQRAIVFICHSLGGLVVKEMLRTAHTLRNPHWKPVARSVRGVVFFGTPHEGSDHAVYASYLSRVLGISAIVQEQQANAYNLLKLAQWYRDIVTVERVGALVYTERDSIPVVGTIVKRGSGDPGLPGAAAVEIDAHHTAMCKLPTRNSIYEQVLRFVGDCLAQEEGGLHDLAPTPTPFTIPDPVADFTGRENKIAVLESTLAGNGRAAICAVNGMGGVGKSQLAFAVAQRMAGQFPDGQVYLDMQGMAANPLKPESALADLIRAVHPNAKPPADLAGLKALYVQSWRKRRALLLLDNARDEAQVRDLAPPAPVAMLVTSRRQILPEGGRMVPLGVLPEPEAISLLREVLGTARAIGEEEAKALAQECGRLPLALRAAGSFLLRRSAWTVAEYLAELRGRGIAALDKVETVLGLSLDRLADEDNELVQRFTVLGAFPAGFDAVAATAVWQTEPRAARDTLDLLAEWSLVQVEAAGRYRLHDLVRDLALGRANPPALGDARMRHAGHYKEMLAQANELYLSGGARVLQGLALFDAERVNIEAGRRWAVGVANSLDEAAALVFDYSHVGVYLLSLRLTPLQWFAWLDAALAACRRLGNRRGESQTLGNLGNAWGALNEARKAVDFHRQHLTIAREIGDRRGEGLALNNLGLAWVQLGKAEAAVGLFERAAAIGREIGDRHSEGLALGNIGLALMQAGRARKAISFFKERLIIAREIGDRHGEGQMLGNIGGAWTKHAETRMAIGFSEQADKFSKRAIVCLNEHLVIAHELGDRHSLGTILNNLGSVQANLGKTREAIYFYEQAIVIAREVANRDTEGKVLYNSADEYEKLGERDKAIANAKAALAIFRAIESPHIANVESWLRARNIAP